MPDAADAIISIHPGYADAILAGTKTIELRRRVPKLTTGSQLWIYATRPTGAVIGVVTVQDVTKAHPMTIWKKHRSGARGKRAALAGLEIHQVVAQRPAPERKRGVSVSMSSWSASAWLV
jgi:hypothetical protein